MRKVVLLSLVVILFLASFSAFAGTKRSITLNREATVAGTQLKPGDYRIEINENQVIFLRNNKEVARSAARVETAPAKHKIDSIRYNGDAISEIRAGGTTMTVILLDAKTSGGM